MHKNFYSLEMELWLGSLGKWMFDRFDHIQILARQMKGKSENISEQKQTNVNIR